MMGFGRATSRMVKEWRLGLMGQGMKVYTWMGRRLVGENIVGLMEVAMMVSGMRIESRDRVDMNGWMVVR